MRDGPTHEGADRGECEQRGESEHAVAPDQRLEVQAGRLYRSWRRAFRGGQRLDHRLRRGGRRRLRGRAANEPGAVLRQLALQPVHRFFQREEPRAHVVPVCAHVRQLPLAAEEPSSLFSPSARAK